LKIIDTLVLIARFKIHKIEMYRGLGQSVANVEYIPGCVSQTLMLSFDDIRLDGVMEVAQDHSVSSFAPRLETMVDEVVCLELFRQSTVGNRGLNIDFDRFICEQFAIILLLLKNGRELGHHIVIIVYTVHIYGRWFLFPGLLVAGSILRSREVFV
jgi:hypothetical protein